MVGEKKIAQNYVSSLYDLARAHNNEKQILADLQQMTQAVSGSAELVEMFASPIISSDKKEAVAAALSSKMKLNDISKRFLETVIKHHRIHLLPDITQMFLERHQAQNNIKTVQVKAASKLSKAAEKLLQDYLEKRLGMGVEMSVELDETIIGGVRVSYDSMMLDFSTAGAVTKIEKALQNS